MTGLATPRNATLHVDPIISQELSLSATLDDLVPDSTPVSTWPEFKTAVHDAATSMDRVCGVTHKDYLAQIASADRVRQLRDLAAEAVAAANQTVQRRNRATQYVDAVHDEGGSPDPATLVELVVDLTHSPYVWIFHHDTDVDRARAVGSVLTPLTWYDEADCEDFPFEGICESVFVRWGRHIPGHVVRSVVLSAAAVKDTRPASGATVTIDEFRKWRWLDSALYPLWEGWLYASRGTAEAGDLPRFCATLCGTCQNALEIDYASHDMLTIPSDLIEDEPNLWLVKLVTEGDYRVSAAWANAMNNALCTSGCAAAPSLASHAAGVLVWSYLNGRYANCYQFIRKVDGDGSGIDLAPLSDNLLKAIGGREFATAITQSRHRDAITALQKHRRVTLSEAHLHLLLDLVDQGTTADDNEIDWFADATTELITMRGQSIPAADLATDLLNAALAHKMLTSDCLRSYLGYLDGLFEGLG